MSLLKRVAPIIGLFALTALSLAGCGSSTVTVYSSTPTATATSAPGAQCAQLVPGAAPFTSISGITGLTLPTGTYISSATSSGGGAGEYKIDTYTACFQGVEAQIDGVGSNATFAQLQGAGWKLNNLFPDPSNFTYIDYCSNAHNCFNTTGSPNPFTFLGFNSYATPAAGYTTFTMQVATIAAPTCLNDPDYYSGTPTYQLYYDTNNTSPTGDPSDHFLLPPGTRNSTFKGGGTAGSTYVYYCSAGSAPQIVQFLSDSMKNVGWTISGAASAGFTATHTYNGRTYQIDLSITNANNYYLRVFVPQ